MAERVPVEDLPDLLDGLLRVPPPEHTAIVCGDRRLTFGELDAAATALAGWVHERVSGGVVAVAATLSPDFAVAYYGVLRSGNVVATINPLLREDDLVHVLGTSGAAVAIVDSALAARIPRDRLPGLAEVVVLGTPLSGRAPASAAKPDDVATLHFTSGTTGRPKAVRLTHRNLVVNAWQIAHAHRLTAGSVAVNHLPTYHPMHQNSAILAGATQVLCPAPDPVASIEEANRVRATHLYSLPFRLAGLAADPRLAGLRLDTVGAIASGGSALSPEAATRLSTHFGVPVFQGYGLAETSPLTHSEDPADPVPGSVGRAVAGTGCRVVDVASREVLPVGSAGEVEVRGPQVMKGYLGDADVSGWFATGDIGRLDETGRLFLLDRIKDVFKYHNWLISPAEIERVLGSHPAVADCVVFDHPEEPAGSVPHALVVLTGAAQALADVVAEVNGKLPYFQQIRFAEPVAAIPRSANGKLRRRELRDRHVASTAAVAFAPADSPV